VKRRLFYKEAIRVLIELILIPSCLCIRKKSFVKSQHNKCNEIMNIVEETNAGETS
jgi:hypothetical protein